MARHHEHKNTSITFTKDVCYNEHSKSPINMQILMQILKEFVFALIGLADNHTKITNMDGKARVLHMYDKNKPGLHTLG